MRAADRETGESPNLGWRRHPTTDGLFEFALPVAREALPGSRRIPRSRVSRTDSLRSTSSTGALVRRAHEPTSRTSFAGARVSGVDDARRD
ncbi:MAG: hypothetical protein WKF84_24795 [Pyrinomonadaceae bacterium]